MMKLKNHKQKEDNECKQDHETENNVRRRKEDKSTEIWEEIEEEKEDMIEIEEFERRKSRREVWWTYEENKYESRKIWNINDMKKRQK